MPLSEKRDESSLHPNNLFSFKTSIREKPKQTESYLSVSKKSLRTQRHKLTGGLVWIKGS